MKFKIADISIKISFWFISVITLMLLFIPESQAFYCFIFCIVHEAGHLLAMLLSGQKATSVEFSYFGIRISADNKLLSAFKNAFIAAGGPVTNLFSAAVLFPCGQADLAVINLALAFFNLLPIRMLDGGHILSSLFPDSKAVKNLSTICCVFLLITGVVTAIYPKHNLTILIVALYLLTGSILQK